MDYAKKACELTESKNSSLIDRFACAFSECSDFQEAAWWQKSAIEMPDFPATEFEHARKRLELFEKEMSYREQG